MTPEEAVQEWDELAGLWKEVEQAVSDLTAGTGDLALVRAAAEPCRDLARHIWARSSPTPEALLGGGTLSLNGEVGPASGMMSLVDARIMPATTVEAVRDAVEKGKGLIRLGRMYAVPPK